MALPPAMRRPPVCSGTSSALHGPYSSPSRSQCRESGVALACPGNKLSRNKHRHMYITQTHTYIVYILCTWPWKSRGANQDKTDLHLHRKGYRQAGCKWTREMLTHSQLFLIPRLLSVQPGGHENNHSQAINYNKSFWVC